MIIWRVDLAIEQSVLASEFGISRETMYSYLRSAAAS
jgi:predicted DNA binding protein